MQKVREKAEEVMLNLTIGANTVANKEFTLYFFVFCDIIYSHKRGDW